jgi:hypothetical protein
MTPGANRVHADAALGVFDRERLGGGVEAALGQRRQHGRHAIDGVIDQAGGDLHDVAAALLLHFRNRQLGDAEEAGEVDAERAGEIGLAVLGERFCDEDAGVVDQRVDAAEPGHGFCDHALRRSWDRRYRRQR